MSHTTTALDFTVSWQQHVLQTLRKPQALACCFRVHVHLLSLISLRCWQSPYSHPLNCWEVLANNTSFMFMKKEKGNEGEKETRKQQLESSSLFPDLLNVKTVQPTAQPKTDAHCSQKKTNKQTKETSHTHTVYGHNRYNILLLPFLRLNPICCKKETLCSKELWTQTCQLRIMGNIVIIILDENACWVFYSVDWMKRNTAVVRDNVPSVFTLETHSLVIYCSHRLLDKHFKRMF